MSTSHAQVLGAYNPERPTVILYKPSTVTYDHAFFFRGKGKNQKKREKGPPDRSQPLKSWRFNSRQFYS